MVRMNHKEIDNLISDAQWECTYSKCRMALQKLIQYIVQTPSYLLRQRINCTYYKQRIAFLLQSRFREKQLSPVHLLQRSVSVKNLAIWLLLLNKGECNLNQSKDDSFVERVAKNNS